MGVDGVELSAGDSVPKADAAVCSASARSKQVGLKRAPGYCLDGSKVRCEGVTRPRAVRRPNVQEIVVAAARKLLAAGGPCQTAYLLLVTPKCCCEVLSLPTSTTDLSYYISFVAVGYQVYASSATFSNPGQLKHNWYS